MSSATGSPSGPKRRTTTPSRPGSPVSWTPSRSTSTQTRSPIVEELPEACVVGASVGSPGSAVEIGDGAVVSGGDVVGRDFAATELVVADVGGPLSVGPSGT